MMRAGSGLSFLPESRAAGEEAALAALLDCDDARHLLVFASHHHAPRFAALAAGAASISERARVTGCSGYGVATEAGLHLGMPAVAVLAIAGEDLLLREGQRPRGPADALLLARELGAPRGMRAYFLWPGPQAGEAEAIVAGMTAGLPGFAAGLAGHWGEPATTIGPDEVTPGGTLAWLLAGACTVTYAVAPAFDVAAARPPAFGIYLGAVDGVAGEPPRPWAFPVAGLVGAYALAPGGLRPPGVLVAVSPPEGRAAPG